MRIEQLERENTRLIGDLAQTGSERDQWKRRSERLVEERDHWRAHSRFPGHALTPTGVMAIRCKQFHLPDL